MSIRSQSRLSHNKQQHTEKREQRGRIYFPYKLTNAITSTLLVALFEKQQLGDEGECHWYFMMGVAPAVRCALIGALQRKIACPDPI